MSAPAYFATSSNFFADAMYFVKDSRSLLSPIPPQSATICVLPLSFMGNTVEIVPAETSGGYGADPDEDTARAAAPQVSLEEFEELRARVAALEGELAALRGESADERVDAGMPPEAPNAWEVN